MELSKTIGLILVGISGCVILVFIAMPILVKFYDWLAVREARRYCEETGLEYVEAKVWPGHYGLYFKKDGRRLYASFEFERNRTITWRKGSPLEVGEESLKT